MEYIVLGSDGQEYGPVDHDTLCKWIEHGRIFKDSKIRNALVKKWNVAGDMESLKDAFVANETMIEENSIGKKVIGSFLGSHKEAKMGKEKESTAFVHKYKPKPPNALQRIYAFLSDFVLISIYGIFLFFIMASLSGTWVKVNSTVSESLSNLKTQAQEQAEVIKDTSDKKPKKLTEDDIEKEKNKLKSSTNTNPEKVNYDTKEVKETFPVSGKFSGTYYFFLFIFILSIMLYYGISFGIYAQTVGMWYWGLLIVKGHKDEALPLRAFAYVVLSFIFAPTTPFIVLINPIHRSIQGYLTGTRLVCVKAQSDGL
jgi:uncharacterized RDD family membrane protein YckC